MVSRELSFGALCGRNQVVLSAPHDSIELGQIGVKKLECVLILAISMLLLYL